MVMDMVMVMDTISRGNYGILEFLEKKEKG